MFKNVRMPRLTREQIEGPVARHLTKGLHKGMARAIYLAGAGVGQNSDSLTKMAHNARFEDYWLHRRKRRK